MDLEQFRDQEFMSKIIGMYVGSPSPALVLNPAEVVALVVHCNTVGIALVPVSDLAEMHQAWTTLQDPTIKKLIEDGRENQGAVVRKR